MIGVEKALFLVGRLPRYYSSGKAGEKVHVSLYVPTIKRLKFTHDLVNWLGWIDAEKLSQAFGGEILQLGTCIGIYRQFRDENIIRLIKQGTPISIIATWFEMSEKHIKNLAREIGHEENRRAANDNGGSNSLPYGRRRNDVKTDAA